MSKNTLEVFRIGSKVKLTDDVEGVITAIAIRGNNHVTYECGWWNGRSHDNKWFHADEIEVTTSEKSRIGFA